MHAYITSMNSLKCQKEFYYKGKLIAEFFCVEVFILLRKKISNYYYC